MLEKIYFYFYLMILYIYYYIFPYKIIDKTINKDKYDDL